MRSFPYFVVYRLTEPHAFAIFLTKHGNNYAIFTEIHRLRHVHRQGRAWMLPRQCQRRRRPAVPYEEVCAQVQGHAPQRRARSYLRETGSEEPTVHVQGADGTGREDA